MTMKKLLSALLSLMIVTSLAACSDNASDDSAETTAAETTTAEVTTAEPTNEDLLASAKSAMPEADYEGYIFTFLDREDSNLNWSTVDVYAESENGDAINDAVFARNMALEEHFNIEIAERRIPHSQVTTTATTEILSGDETFDVITDGLSYISQKLAAPGYLIDINDIPEIDLSQPYWDQLMTEYMTIKGKTFFATGDISIMDNLGTWALLFNKQFAEDFKLDDPYTHVHEGTWTLDVFHDMAKAVAVDVNGDSVMDENDQFGFLSENSNTFLMWQTTGQRLSEMTSEGVPELTMYNERAVAVLEKVQQIQLDRTTTITGSEYPNGMLGINDAFGEGKGMFIYGGMMLISKYRASEINFGIVPGPKYDEAQERYYAAYSNSNTVAYAIPITASDTSRTGNIVEQTAILSQYTLTPAYYDITLEGKFLRDDESAEMIDIILSSRNYDIASVYDWGTCRSMFNTMYANKSSDFASAYAAIEQNAKTAIEKFIESLN